MNARLGLVHAVLLATADLSTTVPAHHPSARNLGTERMGSGTVIDPAGIILTVNYVVNGADSITVTLADGKQYPGQLMAQDFDSGIALVKIDANDLPFLRPAETVTVGQPAFMIASSGQHNRRVSDGNVTSLEGYDGQWEYMLEKSIRVSAFNPGFGGGTLADTRGRLLGVVSLNLNDIGKFTMAIPVEYYLRDADELRNFGRVRSRPARPWLGLYSQAMGGHVLITGVTPSGPAEKAGLKQGDIILAVERQEVQTRPQLYREVWKKQAGDVITFRVIRGDGAMDVQVPSIDRWDRNRNNPPEGQAGA
ncbi:MAG: S1C family serine protease [Deltaproteobacteria bacterium]|nr:S1C family serine protease [Deltaproteobacteria bacterium]